MKIQTKFFGEIEIEEGHIINFVEGIPGFTEYKKYTIIHDDKLNLSFLQSVEEANLCFITMHPAMIVGDYSFDLSDDIVEKLIIEKPEDVTTLAILNIPEDFKKMTANLRAPLVINTKNNRAVQVLLDDDNYSMKHRVFKEDV